ncbi:MAG: DNA-binding transcriptional regulator LsrR (DeoR family) [Reinekea sp.]|jgi:DNA-binding transcriptional regulator LsrR (DeoR family)
MAKPTSNRISESASNRSRAAWLYFMHGLTQREVAEHLGISRSTVIRMLEEVRARGEVQIIVATSPQGCIDLEAELELRLGLKRAIVVPSGARGTAEEAANGVGAALGTYLSGQIVDGMVVGIGWGRTLNAMIPNLSASILPNTTILSLLGGLTSNRGVNMVDVSRRVADRLGSNCLLMPAPLVVNSAETKRALIEECGLDKLFAVARSMDIAVISCGETIIGGTSFTEDLIPANDYKTAINKGAAADVMCHFIDADGHDVDVSSSARIMSIPLDDIAHADEIVLACGGSHRAKAIQATLRRLKCQTLLTDEAAARALLEL